MIRSAHQTARAVVPQASESVASRRSALSAPGAPLYVGLNLLYLLPGVVGGTETYAAGLIRALAEEPDDVRYIVFVNRECAAWPLPDDPRFRRVVCPVDATNRALRYAWEQARFPGVLSRWRLDVLHSLGYVSPLRAACPTVVSIHDLNFRAFGSEMTWIRRTMLGYFVSASARSARIVVTLSDYSRRQIVEELGVSSERVKVIALGPRTDPGRADNREPQAATTTDVQEGSYIIAFSSASPNKNIPRLVDAFARARLLGGIEQRLILVGHPPTGGIPDTGDALPANAIHWTGYVTDEEVTRLLRSADMLVCPSVYEGFGLPVLEAMAAGVPIACSAVASLPEVAGDAAVYFDPHSVGSIAEALTRLAGSASLRASLRERGLARARQFSWATTARETMAVYRDVVGVAAGPVERATNGTI